ncbi:MAG: hypothetical protein RL846_43375, partial [Deltaproteobacteria bacterium]
MNVRTTLAVLLPLLVSACTQETVLIERTGASIGPDGGKLMSADGIAELVIPAGALDTTTEITIEVRSVERADLVSRLYDFGPDGLTFTNDATLALRTGGRTDVVLAWADPERPVPLANQTIEGGVARGALEHFSTYGMFNSAAQCTSDADCLMGQLCTNGTCGTAPNACMTNADCPPSQVCDPSVAQCVPGNSNVCMSDADCPANQVCDPSTAQCVPGSSNGCMTDADCPANQQCNPMTNQCVPGNNNGCTSNADCPMGQICDPNTQQCTPGNNNGCTSNADCAPSQVWDPMTNQCVPGNNNGCMTDA